MRSFDVSAIGLFAVVAVIALCAAAPATAQEEAPAGFLGDSLRDFTRLGGQVTSLAEAIPAESYSWRPAEGVRSVGEAFMHLAEANYRILGKLGLEAPAGLEEMESRTDKESVLAALEQCFADVQGLIRRLPAADLEQQVQLFGFEFSKRAVLLIAAGHSHEHLGQAIAYARMNGVTPPWSQGGGDG